MNPPSFFPPLSLILTITEHNVQILTKLDLNKAKLSFNVYIYLNTSYITEHFRPKKALIKASVSKNDNIVLHKDYVSAISVISKII